MGAGEKSWRCWNRERKQTREEDEIERERKQRDREKCRHTDTTDKRVGRPA